MGCRFISRTTRSYIEKRVLLVRKWSNTCQIGQPCLPSSLPRDACDVGQISRYWSTRWEHLPSERGERRDSFVSQTRPWPSITCPNTTCLPSSLPSDDGQILVKTGHTGQPCLPSSLLREACDVCQILVKYRPYWSTVLAVAPAKGEEGRRVSIHHLIRP
jgi:hypothetical protein